MPIIEGFHGTNLKIAQLLVSGALPFWPSVNPDDWLGEGSYFFEGGPRRARTWARRRWAGTGETPAVVAVKIDLDGCLDLFDSQAFFAFRSVWAEFVSFEERMGYAKSQAGLVVDQGQVYTTVSSDTHLQSRPPIKNFRDCTFIDWYCGWISEMESVRSVRAAFLWGNALFAESHLFDWAHAQIAVRDQSVLSAPRLIEI